MLEHDPDFLSLPPEAQEEFLNRVRRRVLLDVRGWIGAILVVVVPIFVSLLWMFLTERLPAWLWFERIETLVFCGLLLLCFVSMIYLNMWLHDRLCAAASEKEMERLRSDIKGFASGRPDVGRPTRSSPDAS